MIETLAIVILIVLASRVLEEFTRVPINLPLIAISFFAAAWLPNLRVTPETFDQVLIMLLPVILFPDVINLSVRDLRRNGFEIFYLALVGVGLSLLLAVLIAPFLLPGDDWTPGLLACLFAPLMATDAITVTSMAGKFSLPERLKVVAESESLFNDATALIAFFFIAIPMLQADRMEALPLVADLVWILLSSTVVGIAVSIVGFVAIKFLRDPVEQFFAAYLVSIGAYIVADYFGLSGILAVLIALMAFRVFIDREVKRGMVINYELKAEIGQLSAASHGESVLRRVIQKLEELILLSPALSSVSFRAYRKEAIYIGLFANAVLFILIAQLVRPEMLLRYQGEILAVFLLTTGLRYIMVLALAWLRNYPMRWINALTFAGMKGGLTLVMAHSLPRDLPQREMLESITIGVVLLSIFLYTFFLLAYLGLKKQAFLRDRVVSEAFLPERVVIENLGEAIERDPVTGIYNSVRFREILTREVQRAGRYKSPLSILMIEFVNYAEVQEQLGETGQQKLLKDLRSILTSDLSVLDHVGRVGIDKAAVLTIHKAIDDNMELIQHIRGRMAHFASDHGLELRLCFGIAAFADGDTPEMLMEKAFEAVGHARLSACRSVGIAV